MSRINNPKYLIIHHTGGTINNPDFDTSGLTIQQINESHRQRYNFISSLGFYVGYHYVITKDGKLYQTRIDNEEGAHCYGMNITSIGIEIVGNFSRPVNTDNFLPTQTQKESLKGLIVGLMKKYSMPLANVVPHRHFANTECYGKNLDNKWAQRLVEEQLEDKDEIVDLLKKKISIIQKLIEIYTRILNILFRKGRDYE